MTRALVAVIALLAGATAAAEHPPGWSAGGDGYEIRLDRAEYVAGGGSLLIERVGPGSAGFALRWIPADGLQGGFVRLSAAIRSDDVERGYAGLLLRFDDDDGILYLDNMRDRGVTGTTDWARHSLLARVPDGARWVVYGALLAGDGKAWFDTFFVEGLDAEEVPDAPDDVVAYLDRALNIMARHALRAADIDWPAFRALTLERAAGTRSVADAHPVLRDALRRLDDRHSRLMTPAEFGEWEAGPPVTERPMPRGERIGPGIARLELPRFDGIVEEAVTRYVTAAHRVIAGHPSCGWVVDLRGNSGGNMWPMLAAIGPLLDTDVVGGFEGAHGQRAEWWYRDGAAGVDETEGARVAGAPARADPAAVALLTGPTTASSGEAVAVAFAGQDGARRFGSETAGLTTGTQQFFLSDGAVMWLTTSRFLDRDGRAYDGALEPHAPVIPRAGDRRDDPVLADAADWLRSRCASVR